MSSLTRLPLLCLFLFCTLQTGFAQYLPESPSKELVTQLLSQRDDRLKRDYTVVLVLLGEAKHGEITLPSAAQVTYFGPEITEGKKVRVLEKETLFWNEEYGWFLYHVGEHLGRTTVYVWSELEGEIEVD